MALYKIIETPGFSIGVWKIEEDAAYFEKLFDGHPDIQNQNRRLQWFASRHLANQMLGKPVTVVNDDAGKPSLKNTSRNISISHSIKFAAVMLSSQSAVGVDVEMITPKIERIAHKFLTAEEIAAIPATEKIDKLILYWSAKEALFKLYGWGGVDFKKHLIVEPFTLQNEGTVHAHILTPNLPLQNLTLYYTFFEDHVLTYVAGL